MQRHGHLLWCGRVCLLWTVCSLGKTRLAFALLHSVLQGQICLLLQVSLDLLLLHSSPLWWKGYLLGVLFLEGVVGRHRPVQLKLLWHYWLGHRLGLLWYWMVCLGNKQRSFCHFWDHTQVLHFRLFCWLWCLLHFFKRILAHCSRYNGYLMLKIFQARLQQYVNHELPDVQAGFRKGRGTSQHLMDLEKAREFQKKKSISVLLTMPKLLTVWITINCGKFWKRWEYQTTWPASWEICMQVRKQQC